MPSKPFIMSILAASALCFAGAGPGESIDARRREAVRQQELGNYRNAMELFRLLALDSANPPKDAVLDIRHAIENMNNLGEVGQIEPFLAAVREAWSGSWRVLAELARQQIALPALVTPLDGAFVRAQSWGRSNFNAGERDRAVAVNTMLEAEKLLDSPGDAASPAERQNFYTTFLDIVGSGRIGAAVWRFSHKTDLATLPEPEDYGTFYGWGERGAPVDSDGNPLYYAMPESWESAASDGERWRWLLGRLAASGGAGEADLRFAQFLLGQFGVQTMGRFFPMPRSDDESKSDTGAFAVRTLGENETIARLAGGLKRFTLPDEYNYIAILRRLADSGGVERVRAAETLAQIFENRQQYPKALSFWQRIAPSSLKGDDHVSAAIKRIAGKNGMLEAGPVEPAGVRSRIPYLFRNGSAVAMKAQRLDEQELLRDVRAMLRANDQQAFNSNPAAMRPEQIGRLVVERDVAKYVKETTAEWEVKLDPLPDHLSSRAHIELPFSLAGCYLVTASMADGNTSRAIVWLADLAVVRKAAFDRQICYVADAVTGRPVANANLSFLGFSVEYRNNNRQKTTIDEFAELADGNGLVVLPSARFANKNWLITAESPDGRLAYLGFDHIWADSAERGAAREIAYIITDRPAYRPDQKVEFKIWAGNATYGRESAPLRGNVDVLIRNPRGEIVYDKTLALDSFGGAADSITLDGDAPLGQYFINVKNVSGGVGFRLEEYKKPEYEVTVDAPDKALELGDTVTVKVGAKYYFGSPVTDAAVSYKVVRTPHAKQWFPPWRWDWLYGSGAWWQGYDYDWLRGWDDWGVARPTPAWLPGRPFVQPEVVAEGEGVLDAEGVFRLNIDTMPAKELFGHQDHQYEITVEVTDKSRRTISGSGKVVAARKPFTATVWANRGWYAVGQEMDISVRAALPLGGGVKAKGSAVLYRLTYDRDGNAAEEEVALRDIETDEQGNATFKLSADVPGQYRVSCRLADGDGKAVEGAAVLTIRGEKGEGDFRYAALELVPDRRDYQPGDTVRLAVNSDNRDGVVLLFPRSERGGGKPMLVRLDNGGAALDFPIGEDDQPNFFFDALIIQGGRIHQEVREIFVPPAKKDLNIAITPDKESYLPGGKANFQVAVTDTDGKPVAGQIVVSIYDKSVEYITGGSNVGDIRSHFWKWKRHYNPMTASSLNRHGYRVFAKGDVEWEPIGIFGGQEADWNDDHVYANGRAPLAGGRPRSRMMRAQSVGYGSGEIMMDEVAMPMAAAPAPAQAEMSVAQEAAPMERKTRADAGGGFEPAMAETAVRSDFADTALWMAALETDAAGKAAFSLDMPENLTAWKARTWVMASATRVGEAETQIETRKNIIVRPQAPRFLTQKDQVVLSANLHNYLPRGKDARAELVLEGGLLEVADGVELSKSVRLSANGEARVDWLVDARRPGEAVVIMKLLADEESDAAEIKVPVVLHGARTVQNFGGVIKRSENETVISFRVPEDRLADKSRLEVTFSPSLAASMLDALPFLVDYPYGCTEQTLNRFLPAVMTRKYLENLGLSLARAEGKIAGQTVDAQSAEWLRKFGDSRATAKPNPVFDDAELAKMVKQGVERLAAMQVSDGGWGWFSGYGERSWPHTTAVVVHGLLTAKENGVAIPSGVLDQGVAWLRAYRQAEVDKLKLHQSGKDEDKTKGKQYADNLDAFIHMLLSTRGYTSPDMRDFLHRDRLRLSLSGLAMLGIALHEEGAASFLDIVLQNIEQFVQRDNDSGTLWLGEKGRGGWWWWYNDDIETQAWYLALLSRTDPLGDAASGVAKYLLQNRKNGSYWRSTRDTAYAIEALTRYASASGETNPDMTVEVFYDGKKVLERKLTAATLLDDHRFVLEGVAVEAGDHEIRIVRSGEGPLYFGGGLDVFSLEDPIAKAGADLAVERSFFKLVREDATSVQRGATGQAVVVGTEKYRRVPMPSPFDNTGADAEAVALRPGDLVEVELAITAKNDYEYLVFEDMKAAGLEAVELLSGYSRNGLGAYIEYRDQKVVLFVRHLPRGEYTISYRFRAETPGSFSALPTFGGGMYATDLFANSDEMKLRIVEEGVFGE